MFRVSQIPLNRLWKHCTVDSQFTGTHGGWQVWDTAASLLTGSQAIGTQKFCCLLDFQLTEHLVYIHKGWTHCALGLVGRLRLWDSGVGTLFWNRVTSMKGGMFQEQRDGFP